MNDLHDRLLAAISARENRTRVAAPYYEDRDELADELTSEGFDAELVQFAVVENPAAVLRHITRDRRVLKRHSADSEGLCWHGEETAQFWPCVEVVDLAEAYGV